MGSILRAVPLGARGDAREIPGPAGQSAGPRDDRAQKRGIRPNITDQLTHPESTILLVLNDVIHNCTYNSVRRNVPAGTYVKFT